MGRGRHRRHSLRKRVPPCEGGKLAYSDSFASDADARMVAEAKHLQVNESAADASGKTCSVQCHLHQTLTHLGEEGSFQFASADDSIDIRHCKFLAAATNLVSASDSSCKFSILLRQRLIHRHPRLQVPPQPPPLQHPAAASSTVASYSLRATNNLSYGSSLIGPLPLVSILAISN